MTQQTIGIGTTANDNTGDPLRTAFTKANAMFAELYQLKGQDEVAVASAATTDIGAAAGFRVEVTGTTTITSFGATPNAVRFVRFSGALILTHNATSLILPGAANITTAAGDTALAVSDGSGNWRVFQYTRASQGPRRSKVITLTRNISLAGASVAYTGVGFKPRTLMITGCIDATTATWEGFCDDSRSGAGKAYLGGIWLEDASAFMMGTGPSDFQRGSVASYDDDGFTVTWATKFGTPTGTAKFQVLCQN